MLPISRVKDRMFPIFHGKNLKYGKELQVTPAAQLESNQGLDNCRKACMDNTYCLYVTYNDQNRICRQYGLEKDDTNKVGIKSLGMYDIYSGKIKFDDASPPNNCQNGNCTENECAKKCTQDPECFTYQYISPGSCYFHNFRKDPEITTAIKTEDRRPELSAGDLKAVKCCLNAPDASDCNQFKPHNEKCESFMDSFCKRNPLHDSCRCINRDQYHIYRNLKSKNAETPDECWYPHCHVDDHESYIPKNMMPIAITVPSDNGHISIPNLKCAKSYQTPFKDPFNIEGFSHKSNNILWTVIIIIFLLILLWGSL